MDDGQFLLTSNRDEAPHRSPERISRDTIGGQQLAFPRDEEAGGTWIVIADSGRLCCILNGAFEKHDRKPPYRRSRGLMALDFFLYRNFQKFSDAYAFEGMEAFTIIVCEYGKAYELRWDETHKHIREIDANTPHIWSSATLYPEEIRQKREKWFADWLEEQQGNYSREAILHFHQTAGEGDPWNDVVMNRNNLVRTVSITSISRSESTIDMKYNDLLRERLKETKISLNREVVESS
jgi:uncharacterized protein with NRDE domain